MTTHEPPEPPNQNTDRTLESLRRNLEVLRLTQIDKQLDALIEWGQRESPAPTSFLERALTLEAEARLASRAQRRIQQSGLSERKTLEGFDWNFQPKLDKAQVLELAQLHFIRRADDLLITGETGTGKSHILQAIALRACHAQLSVRYTRCVDLLNHLFAGIADDSYPQRLRRWATPQLLVIDDVGLGQITRFQEKATAAHMLYDLLDRRHGRVCTAMSSNIKLSEWGGYLGDVTLSGAILDRVTMRAIRIYIDGPSYRQKVAQERADQRQKKTPRKTRTQKDNPDDKTQDR